jgi:hypothetical protein
MLHRTRRFPYLALALAIVLISFSFIAHARAWNSPGHMIVALVAYEQMSDATRAKANELLRAHPRFEPHFERLMPREVTRESDEVKAKWRFAHAGTWPDLVRDTAATVDREDVNRFNRPYWHYINKAIFLSDAERAKLEPNLKLYDNPNPPDDRDDPSMNIVQAVKNSSRIVSDPSAPADMRAVHLCWLVHLAGDSHQPLHACSLYTSNRFPRGDKGGNELEAEHEWKLHAFWDSQVCTQEAFETLQILAANLTKDDKKAAAGKNAAASTDIETWINESNAFAKRFAYTPEVLQKIADRESHTHLGPLDVSDAYKADAESLAERRATEAGYRLAALLEQLLNK